MKFCYITSSPFLNNPKGLDPSYRMDLDFWDCFGRKQLCLIIKEIWYCLQFISLLVTDDTEFFLRTIFQSFSLFIREEFLDFVLKASLS